MIFVIVGTNYFSFDRLLKSVDLDVHTKSPKVMQVGVSSYIPKTCDYFDYKDKKSIIRLMRQSDLVITHGGYGTIMDALSMHKKIIAVPRRTDFGECLDNQEELVRYFEEKNYLVGCYDLKDLPELIDLCLAGQVDLAKYEPESNLKIRNLIQEKLVGHLKIEQ